MKVRRLGAVAALTLLIAIVPPQPSGVATGTDVTETQISAAAIGYFDSGTSFNGVPIQSATFGIGDSHRNAGQRQSYRAGDALACQGVRGIHAGFGHPVAFENR